MHARHLGQGVEEADRGLDIQRRRQHRDHDGVHMFQEMFKIVGHRAGWGVDNYPFCIFRQPRAPGALAGAVDGQDGGFQFRPALGPAGRGALRIGIHQHSALALQRELRGQVGGHRGLARATLGAGDQNRLHAHASLNGEAAGYTGRR